MSKLIVEQSIVISRPLVEVWAFFSDLTCWAQWNFGVTEAVWIKGEPWVKGSVFKFTSISGKRENLIKPTILDCQPPEYVTWQGKVMTIKGLHTFKFEKVDETKTKVTTHEEFSGVLLPIMGRFISVQEIKETFSKSLANLKKLTEKQP